MVSDRKLIHSYMEEDIMKEKYLHRKRALCAAVSATMLMNSFGTAAFAEGSPGYKDGTYVGQAGGIRAILPFL